MNHDHIRRLLDRYEAAETTLAEERELRAYFQADDGVAADLRRYAPLFAVQRVLAKAAPTTAPSGPWDAAPTTLRVAHRRRTRWLGLAAAAAVALLIALALPNLISEDAPGPLAQNSTTTTPPTPAVDWSKYEITDPEEAVRLTRGALATVATGLRSGGELTHRELGRLKPIGDVL